jgi:hypothetical protein
VHFVSYLAAFVAAALAGPKLQQEAGGRALMNWFVID